MTGRFQYLIPEILGRIFEHYMVETEDKGDDDYGKDPCPSKAPLMLGRICSHWRHVAESTPSLWCSLTLSINYYHNEEQEDSRYLNALKVFMTRSGALPVSISFERNRVYDMALFGKELALHSLRWRSLKLRGDQSVMQILGALQEGAPLLETLEVETYDPSTTVEFDAAAFPRLSYLLLSFGVYTLKPSSPPLSNLRSLNLKSEGLFDNVLNWVQHCPALEQLTVDLEDERIVDPLVNGEGHHVGLQFELPLLTTLDLHCYYDADFRLITLMLDHFRTPALLTLRLGIYPSRYGAREWRERFFPHIFGFLNRCSPSLEQLDITACCLSDDNIFDILALSPSLRILSLGHWVATDRLIKRLTFPPFSDDEAEAETLLCPSLQEFTVEVDHRISEAVLADMIASRWSGTPISTREVQSYSQEKERVGQLREVSVKSYSELRLNSDVSRCIAQGLTLNVSLICIFFLSSSDASSHPDHIEKTGHQIGHHCVKQTRRYIRESSH